MRSTTARSNTAIFSALLFLVGAIGFFLVHSSPSSDSSSLPRDLQDTAEVETKTSLQLAYEDVWTFSPELFRNFVWTWGNSAEEKSKKQNHFAEMVRFHAPMRPCLHKSFWAGIQFFNPGVYDEVGLTAEEKEKFDVRGWIVNEEITFDGANRKRNLRRRNMMEEQEGKKKSALN